MAEASWPRIGHSTKHATMPNVAFARWDPLRDLLALHEQIGQLVGSDAPLPARTIASAAPAIGVRAIEL